jgi:O-acetyl-ADP-ribose deacetylase (regulator of RNase III)
MTHLTSALGDITTVAVDAIVNAANETLLGGGGVDAAVHRAAGPGLLEECRALGGCPTGEARITAGHRLPARWIIHTVGPIWRGGTNGEPEALARCYQSVLRVAIQHGVRTIAMPAISTGVYLFPHAQAARIAVATVRARVEAPIEQVTFVCFEPAMLRHYRVALGVSSR